MKLRRFITRIFFPKRCSICGKTVELSRDFCYCCGDEEFTISKDFCHGCGYDSDGCICQENKSIRLSHIAAVYLYTGAVRQKICAFKFEGEKHLADYFAMKMSERVATVFPDVKFDFVTYVPATKKSVKKRGFNQSELLAKSVAKSFFLPCSDVLSKTRETSFQHNISAQQRTDNLSGAITCTADVKNKTVLLCDDVKTTGATLRECVRALKAKGARDVYCICIALSDYNQDIF